MTTFERRELCDWYQRHHGHLQTYTLLEVVSLASACGFKMQDICRDIDVWIARSKRKLRLWESPMHEKWVRAWLAQNGKEDEI